jgi:hypothetical protein
MKTYGGGGVALLFFTSTLEGGPYIFNPWEIVPDTHWIGGSMGLKTSLDAVQKII